MEIEWEEDDEYAVPFRNGMRVRGVVRFVDGGVPGWCSIIPDDEGLSIYKAPTREEAKEHFVQVVEGKISTCVH